jgi:hypothetical protein
MRLLETTQLTERAPPTLLPFVKDRWAAVVLAFLFRVCVYLSARLMDTFLCHIELIGGLREGMSKLLKLKVVQLNVPLVVGL